MSLTIIDGVKHTYDNIAIVDIMCDECHNTNMISAMYERYKTDARILCWSCYTNENMKRQYLFMKEKKWLIE